MVKFTKTSSLLCGFLLAGAATAELKKTYIVTTKPTKDNGKRDLISVVNNLLQDASVPESSVFYTYTEALSGFAASLTPDDAEKLAAQPDVLSVHPEKVYQLHTTHSPEFLGIADSNALLGRDSTVYSGVSARDYPQTPVRNLDEANIIVGVLDTGAWPESASYDDAGMPDIPSHWKGSCETGERWTVDNCNKKLIGAAAFYKGYVNDATNGTGVGFNWTGQYQSARDDEGHGTHTSSTIAGSIVEHVDLFGAASGTARGMAKDARLAIYKICFKDGCFESDILAAFDKAIADGVNIISGSFGGAPAFQNDPDTVGPYSAMKKGILVSMSAGNSGPTPFTVSNGAPWVMTIGASTIDRDFPAVVTLGNGNSYTGDSLYNNQSEPDLKAMSTSEVIDIVLASNAALSNATEANLCFDDSLDPALVAGKVVVCTRGTNARTEKGAVVKAAGGRAMILVNDEASGEGTSADAHVLPAVHVGYKEGLEIVEYVTSAKNGTSTAQFEFDGTRYGIPAPLMAGFSSRGPNGPTPHIMKPDITGPGVNIIAAWAPAKGVSGATNDTRLVNYNIISGTSMSCPHLSGIGAYIMARRPGWSPAAIRSAIMTTAYVTTKGSSKPLIDSATNEAADPFSFGNGHVDPVAALDPGLIYDITAEEYDDFICSVNSTTEFYQGVTRGSGSCDETKEYSPYALNYPSFGAVYDTNVTTGVYTAVFPRTVTNVGGAGTYTVSVNLADKSLVDVSVEPQVLVFLAAGETKSFNVTVTMQNQAVDQDTGVTSSQGRLEWTDGKHTVASSLGFMWL